MTKKITVEELKEYFKLNTEHLEDFFPEDIEISEIIRYTDRDDYVNILRLYGINYLLILLGFMEKHEQWETCGEIVFQIELYNKQFKTEYKTHL